MKEPILTIPGGWVLFVFASVGSLCAAPETLPSAPAVEAPARFKNAARDHFGRASQPFHIGTGSPASRAWWSIFRDPALDALETQALGANQDLRQAVARLLQAREQSRVAAADFYPHANGTLSAQRQRTTDNGPIEHGRFLGNFTLPSGAAGAALAPLTDLFGRPAASQARTSTFNDFRAPIAVTYEIDLFGRVRAGYSQARANEEASEADRRGVELSLTADVASDYFALRALDAEVAVLRRTVAVRQEASHLQRLRLHAGTANELDVARAEVELDNTQADLDDAVRERGEIENGLAAVCGAWASDFRLAARPLGEAAPPSVPASVPAALLARRPDLVSAQRKIAAAAEGIRIARAELLPTISIEGDAGYDSAQFGHLVEDRSAIWSAVAQVKVPIFEGGRNAANLRAAKARREEALAAYRQAAVTAFKEAENALLDLRQRASQAEARERAVTNARRVVTLSQQLYDEGEVNYFEVTDAQRLLLGAELSRVQTANARYAATISLVRAIGGNY